MHTSTQYKVGQRTERNKKHQEYFKYVYIKKKRNQHVT